MLRVWGLVFKVNIEGVGVGISGLSVGGLGRKG